MSGKKYLLNQKYFKPNYYEAVKYIIPQYLTEDDKETFGESVDIKDLVINSHINIANDLSSVLVISGVEGTVYSSISSLEGITPYFIKQNNLTEITPDKFERRILNKVNKSFTNFTTSSSFYDYISGTLLPSLELNNPTAEIDPTFTQEDTHNYLIQNLSWMYFLNTTGTLYNPSSYVADLIVNKLYRGQPVLLNDTLKGLTEHIWRNNLPFYPSSIFASSNSTYSSGTQQLDNLKTWVDVIYSPLYSDRSDFTVKDCFESYIDYGLQTTEKIVNGPFTKFLRALSFLAYDISDINETIGSFYDIDDCPDEFLPLLADLIGWDLFGTDPQRWRLQLRSAVAIYKTAGTKSGFQSALNSVFPKDLFPIQTYINELYESYIPFLMYYALATESSYFETFDKQTWTPQIALDMQVNGYSSSSMDENIRYVVDHILNEVYLAFPNNIPTIPNELNKFYFRGREFPIPPFEEYPYYINWELNKDILLFIADRLACFGVSEEFTTDFIQYITDNALDDDDEPRSSSFLFFTSGYNDPPNIERLVSELDIKRFEYVPLWSGKSSHFKVVLDASSYDFGKKGIDLSDPDSGDAFKIAARVTRKFAPAHSIPLVSLEIAYLDPFNTSFQSNNLPLILPNKVELHPQNNFVSALNIGSYKRDLNPGGVDVPRSATQSNVSPELVGGTSIDNIDRKTLRRRSYEKVMPFNGYYDRTGFNMPNSFTMQSEASAVSLGLIPSSLQFVPIPDHVNLPKIWTQCEGLDSKNYYYEYAVSNTFASRGDKRPPTKDLVIFAGQSNFNGRGTSDKDIISGVNFWNYTTSSFSGAIVPKENTDISPNPGSSDPVEYGGRPYWGPEVKFAELLKQNGNASTVYMFKYCTDNSWVIDTTAENVGTLSGAGLQSITYMAPLKDNTWCPSTSISFSLYDKFIENVNLAIQEMGGLSEIRSVYFMWNQGETEAGRGQNNDSIALQHKEATEYLLDNFRHNFSGIRNFKFLRVKINDNMASGSVPDWGYYPNGLYSNPSIGDEVAVEVAYGLNTSDPGWYGNWSWSSLPVIRSGQEAMNTVKYGSLLDLDDIPITSDDGRQTYASSYPAGSSVEILGVTATQYFLTSSFLHQNIHYTSDSIDIMGERLFNSWTSEIGYLSDLNKKDIRSDRSQLPDIYETMHRIGEKVKYLEAARDYGEVDLFTDSASNVYQSYANSSTNNGGFPNSVSDYYNYSFGRDLHRLYTIYTSTFERHGLNPKIQELDGANLFSHTFGPILFNHDFEHLGDIGSVLVSSLRSITTLNSKSNEFNGSLSYAASGADDMYVDTYERVLSGAISGVELVHTSGSADSNVFSIFNIDSSFRKVTDDPYMYDNTFILSKAVSDGLPRVRFNISKYQSPTDHPLRTNFLIPDHAYNVKVRVLSSDNRGFILGNRQIGVWVHTTPEDGKMWTYDKNGNWVMHDALVSREDIYDTYGHIVTLPAEDRTTEASSLYQCIDIFSEIGSPVANLRKQDFRTLSFDFHTRNRNILLTKDYRSSNGLLHRSDQNYVIEVFMVPNNDKNTFMLLDTVEVVDLTLKKLSEKFVFGDYQDPLCVMPHQRLPEIHILPKDPPNKRRRFTGECEYRVELSKDDLRKIFKFFNDIAGKNSAEGLASRDANITSTIMGTDGGSKLDYRRKLDFGGTTYTEVGTSPFNIPVFSILTQLSIDL